MFSKTRTRVAAMLAVVIVAVGAALAASGALGQHATREPVAPRRPSLRVAPPGMSRPSTPPPGVAGGPTVNGAGSSTLAGYSDGGAVMNGSGGGPGPVTNWQCGTAFTDANGWTWLPCEYSIMTVGGGADEIDHYWRYQGSDGSWYLGYYQYCYPPHGYCDPVKRAW